MPQSLARLNPAWLTGQDLNAPSEPTFTREIQLWDRHFSTSLTFKI